jgi:hypothetical protein
MTNKINSILAEKSDNPGGACETIFAIFAGDYGVQELNMVIFPPKPMKFRKRW